MSPFNRLSCRGRLWPNCQSHWNWALVWVAISRRIKLSVLKVAFYEFKMVMFMFKRLRNDTFRSRVGWPHGSVKFKLFRWSCARSCHSQTSGILPSRYKCARIGNPEVISLFLNSTFSKIPITKSLTYDTSVQWPLNQQQNEIGLRLTLEIWSMQR